MDTEKLFVEWFCFDRYAHSSCTKMEAELYNVAQKFILYRIVADEDLKEVIRQLKLRQDFLAEQNPRWKRIKIHLTSGADGLMQITIGDSYYFLREVIGNF